MIKPVRERIEELRALVYLSKCCPGHNLMAQYLVGAWVSNLHNDPDVSAEEVLTIAREVLTWD